MNIRVAQGLVFFAASALAADAAITITIAPDGIGGTTYTFAQTSPNPTIPVASLSSTNLQIELPTGMFDQTLYGGINHSAIFGTFDMIARFQDVGSGFSYDVVSVWISNTLSSGSFGFDRAFAQSSGQTDAQFDLVSGPPGILSISPDSFVKGSYSTSSLLFGTVTVNVVPEPASVSLTIPGLLLLARGRRHSGMSAK